MRVTFPAMKGQMGGREFFVTTMALSEVPRFFKFNDWEQQDPALRSQRVLNQLRVPEIANYILENEDGYLFSSITASYSHPLEYIPNQADERIGIVAMELEEMEFVINDGQHRAAAIASALKENPELGKDRISVLLFPMENVGRLQQMFSDLNRFVQKTSRSMDILYDHRDNLSSLVRDLEDEVPSFRGLIDKERTSLPIRSSKMFTLSSIYDANKELFAPKGIADPGTDEYETQLRFAVEYWRAVGTAIGDWERVVNHQMTSAQVRQEKINTHSVVLRAIGGLGRSLREQEPEAWKEKLQKLESVDWRKARGNRVNPTWDNVCIVAGSVVSNRQARSATQAVLKHLLGVELSAQERHVLDRLQASGWKSQTLPLK